MKSFARILQFIRLLLFVPFGLALGYGVSLLYKPYPWIVWLIYFGAITIIVVTLIRIVPIMWSTRHLSKADPLFDEQKKLRAMYDRGEITQEAFKWRSQSIAKRLVVVLREIK